jgi:hypothetical protein
VIAIRWGFNRFYSKSTPESLGYNLTSLGFPASLAAITPNQAFPAITMGGAVSGCSTASTSDYTGFGGDGRFGIESGVMCARDTKREPEEVDFDFSQMRRISIKQPAKRRRRLPHATRRTLCSVDAKNVER